MRIEYARLERRGGNQRICETRKVRALKLSYFPALQKLHKEEMVTVGVGDKTKAASCG